MSSSPTSVSGSSLSSLDTNLKNMLHRNEYRFNLASFLPLLDGRTARMSTCLRGADRGRRRQRLGLRQLHPHGHEERDGCESEGFLLPRC